MLGDVSRKSIPDIGCGTGRLLKKLRRMGANAVGIDISKLMLAEAMSKSSLASQADINDFAWRGSSDAIFSVLTFNYIGSRAAAFEKTWSLLKLGGMFIIHDGLGQKESLCLNGNRR